MINNVFQSIVLNVVCPLYFTAITGIVKNHRNLLDCQLVQVTSYGESYIGTTIQERHPC